MSIFDKRVAVYPYEYSDVEQFELAIEQNYWTHHEFDFISDVQDFHINLTPIEQSAVKNAILAISQIEVDVKKFWGKLGDRFPKSEFEFVGSCFSDSERRHAKAYSHLLKVMGLNDEFSQVLQNPVIQSRVDYLKKYLKGASDNSDESYTLTLALFSIFIEHVSLFSQFLIIKSFNKYKNLLKDIDNVIQSTALEERLHSALGMYLINIIREEYPDWFNEQFYKKLERACKKAYEAELKIVDWIFEKGEIDILSKKTVVEFIKNRFNESLIEIGANPVFETDKDELEKTKWFDIELLAELNTDFFHKRPNTYSKFSKPVQAEDLF